jgi:hypothetical protein
LLDVSLQEGQSIEIPVKEEENRLHFHLLAIPWWMVRFFQKTTLLLKGGNLVEVARFLEKPCASFLPARQHYTSGSLGWSDRDEHREELQKRLMIYVLEHLSNKEKSRRKRK